MKFRDYVNTSKLEEIHKNVFRQEISQFSRGVSEVGSLTLQNEKYKILDTLDESEKIGLGSNHVYTVQKIVEGETVDQLGYFDFNKGTVRLLTMESTSFSDPVSFDKVTMFTDIKEEYKELSEVSSDELVKDQIYKLSENNMLLRYTGQQSFVGNELTPRFTIVTEQGKPRIVGGKRVFIDSTKNMLKHIK